MTRPVPSPTAPHRPTRLGAGQLRLLAAALGVLSLTGALSLVGGWAAPAAGLGRDHRRTSTTTPVAARDAPSTEPGGAATPTTAATGGATGLDTVQGSGAPKSSEDGTLIVGGIVAGVVVLAGGLGLAQLRRREDRGVTRSGRRRDPS